MHCLLNFLTCLYQVVFRRIRHAKVFKTQTDTWNSRKKGMTYLFGTCGYEHKQELVFNRNDFIFIYLQLTLIQMKKYIHKNEN